MRVRGFWVAASAGPIAAAVIAGAASCDPFATDGGGADATAARANDAEAGGPFADVGAGPAACGPTCRDASFCEGFEDAAVMVLSDVALGPFADIDNSGDTKTTLEIVDDAGSCNSRALHGVLRGDAGGRKRAVVYAPAAAEITVSARVRVGPAGSQCKIVDVEYVRGDGATVKVFAAATVDGGIQIDTVGFNFNGSAPLPGGPGVHALVLRVPFGMAPILSVDGANVAATAVALPRADGAPLKVFFGPSAEQSPCEIWIDDVEVR